MIRVMIICPDCNKRLDTGLQPKALAFFKNSRFLGGELNCSYCGHKIHWTKKDLFLERDNFFPRNVRIYVNH